MRIGVASLEYSRTRGLERASAEIANRLAAWGDDIHFYCTAREDIGSSGVRFHHVRTLNLVNSTRIASFAFLGSRAVRNGGYDVTHSHGLAVGCSVITAQSCHRAGMEARRHRSGSALSSTNFGIADTVRFKIEGQNFGERKYRKVIAVAEGVKRELMRWYGVPADDIVVIPNGVDLNEFSPDHDGSVRGTVRKELGLDADDMAILFVGNEYDRKGLEYLIEALHALRMPSVKLIVAGDDERSPYIERARHLGVERQVIFLGHCSQIARYCKGADVFSMPTEYEAFALATLEAAASELPLVVTKVNGTEELVKHGENGLFIPRNGEAIAAALHLLLNDRERRKRMGRAARASVKEYSWDVIAKRTREVYKSIATLSSQKR